MKPMHPNNITEMPRTDLRPKRILARLDQDCHSGRSPLCDVQNNGTHKKKLVILVTRGGGNKIHKIVGNCLQQMEGAKLRT